jgi:hypothetical protein
LREGVGTLYDGRCVAELEALTAGTTSAAPATPDVEPVQPPLPLSRAAHQS